MSDQENDSQLDPEVEKEARLYGWKPEEEYKGKAPWIDADAYVERGRQIAPILKANNESLKNTALQLKTENATLRSEMAQLRTEMETFRDGASQKEIKQQRETLFEQLKEAVKDDDVDAEFKIREQIDALKAPTPAKKPDPPQDKNDGLSPEFKAWNAENSWFGGTSLEDKKKTKEVYRILEDLRDEGSTLVGREIMDAAVRLHAERNRNPDDDKHDKHESGNNGQTARQSGKGFSSLPREAKDACWEDNDKFVGEGKLFKDQKAWEKHYYEQYTGVQS